MDPPEGSWLGSPGRPALTGGCGCLRSSSCHQSAISRQPAKNNRPQTEDVMHGSEHVAMKQKHSRAQHSQIHRYSDNTGV